MTPSSTLVRSQRALFSSGKTRDLNFRRDSLVSLRAALGRRESDIFDALWTDLHKSRYETYVSELGLVQDEIGFAVKNLGRWAGKSRVKTPKQLLPARSFVRREPLGVCLIMAPWNYPLMLTLAPLVGALAGGNCAVLKPSELAPATAQVIESLVAETFDPDHVAVVNGDAARAEELTGQDFDMFFFTGSLEVGRKVMSAASRGPIPVVLELGGKSPCIVNSDADLETAARRVTWGKFFNGGQTCVAPDYLLVHREMEVALLDGMTACIEEFYGRDPMLSDDFARIVNRRHFDRLTGLLASGNITTGGVTDAEQLYIAPTILGDVPVDSPVMNQEIFGPILPVLTYDEIDEAIDMVGTLPSPLALYVFSRDKRVQERVLGELQFGNGCVNDTLVQFTSPHLPIGGVGQSGLGSCHGKASFEAFTHPKSIVKKGLFMDLKLRYPPYAGKLGKIRKLLG